MPFSTFKTEVYAPAGLLWEMMLEKIERPDLYVPGVQEVKILQRFSPLAVERVMVVGVGTSAKTVHEIIVADPFTKSVLFKLKDDPVYTGFVTNLIFDEEDRVELDYTLHWTPKSSQAVKAEPDWAQAIQQAVLHAKQLAEARAKNP